MSEGKKPDWEVSTPVETGKVDEKDKPIVRWVRVGVAFYNPTSETITALIDAAPLNGKLVLTKPKEREQKKTFPPPVGG